MTAESSALSQEIRLAMNGTSADEVISRVKEVVAKQVTALDSSLSVEYTNYFNHTYMPDMVMRWSGTGETRPLYIRSRLDVDVSATEVRGLEQTEPVVLGLTTVDARTAEVVRKSVGSRSRVFVSDITSVNSLTAPESKEHSSPIMQVVRSNLLRIGRGVLGPDDAVGLSDAASRAVSAEPGVAAQGLEDLEQTAARVYAEDGLHQISRVGQLIQSVISGRETNRFELVGGQFSPTEARIVIPYVLSRGDLPENSPVWSYLSSLVDLKMLESMEELDGLDLSPLVTSQALNDWTAARAMLVMDMEDGAPDTNRSWFLRSGMLTAKVGHWLILFAATDKRKLKGRTDGLSANWDDITLVVRSFTIDSANLRGLSRRVSISAEESGNIVRDIASLTHNIPDQYKVTSLGVRVPGSDSESTIDIDFAKMLASVSSGMLPIGELGTATLLLLGHRSPVNAPWQHVEEIYKNGE